jgi:hypothetical protein
MCVVPSLPSSPNRTDFSLLLLDPQKLSGPEWQGLSRQYLVQDFLLSFSDAFDAAMDRLVLADPLLLAEDISTLLQWQGGVRTFETALRLGAKDREGIVVEFGTGMELLEGTEEGPVERRPLQSWGRLLELSSEARAKGTPFSRDLAEQEKQRVRLHSRFYPSLSPLPLPFPSTPLICLPLHWIPPSLRSRRAATDNLCRAGQRVFR